LWILYRPPAFIPLVLSFALLLLALGFFGFILFRGLVFVSPQSPLKSAAAGSIALVSLLRGYFLLIHGTGFLLLPEYWPHFAAFPLSFLSWHGIVRFLEFLTLGLATAGAGILLIGGAEGENEEVGSRRAGTILFVTLGLWPLLLLLDLITLPERAVSPGIFVLSGISLLPAAAIFLLLPFSAGKSHSRARLIFGLLPVLFVLWVAGDLLAQSNALTAGTLAMGRVQTPVLRAPAVPQVAAPEKAPAQVDGAAVFRRICAGCHRFDQKLVGPPLQEVLPKYAGDVDALIDFIRDPVKKNPDYPPMPRLGLPEEEIKAVADYILREAGL
jgi:cytochrome c551/c552